MWTASITVLLITLSSVHTAVVFNCDFDDDNDFSGGSFCGITQPTDDDFDWRRGSSTPSTDTGPGSDVDGTGQFAYIEASNVPNGDHADLALPMLTGSDANYCLRFYYHMYGAHIGTLEVLVTNSTHNAVSVLTLAKIGTNGESEWRPAVIDLNSNADFTVTFRATKGGQASSEPFSDIAIDQIMLQDFACDGQPPTTVSTTMATTPTPEPTSTTTLPSTTSMSPTTTTPFTVVTQESTMTDDVTSSTRHESNTPSTTVTTEQPTISTTPVPDTTSTVPATTTGPLVFECNFDDLCGMENSQINQFDWSLQQASAAVTPSSDSSGDESGSYMLAATSAQTQGEFATLSRELDDVSGVSQMRQLACVRFQHYVSDSSAQLHFIVTSTNGSSTTTVVERDDEEVGWEPTEVDMTGPVSRISFRATAGNASDGVIAVDELRIFIGQCDPTPLEVDDDDSSSDSDELWGLEEQYWIIILIAAGVTLVLLVIIICCVVHAYNRRRKNHSSGFRNSGHFDNMHLSNGGKPNGSSGSASQSGPAGYINAYENGTFQNA